MAYFGSTASGQLPFLVQRTTNTQLFDNTPASAVTGPGSPWTTTWLSQGGSTVIMCSFDAQASNSTWYPFQLTVDGTSIATTTFTFNWTNTIMTVTPIFHITQPISTGWHTVSITIPSGVSTTTTCNAFLVISETVSVPINPTL